MKIHIVSGFLGAGKTTFINKWLPYINGKVCLIENEFGEINIDSRLLPHEIEVKEIYAGCICCNLIGSFRAGIKEIYESHGPDHLIIEPSGVGALSEVLKVCQRLIEDYPGDMTIGNVYTIVDVTAYEEYADNFGAFYLDQVRSASMILFSYTDQVDSQVLDTIRESIVSLNQGAQIVSEDWLKMNDIVFESYMNMDHKTIGALGGEWQVKPVDGVLASYSIARPKSFTVDQFTQVFKDLDQASDGGLLRAKGVVTLSTGKHIHFDYTPFHKEWRLVDSSIEAGVAFIGKGLDKQMLRKQFAKPIVMKKTKGGAISEVNRL